MAEIIPDEGLDWVRNKIFNNESDEKPYIVAVGDGTASPSSTDTSLANELYRANDDDSNCTVAPTTPTGEYEFKITLSGGTEVAAGTTIEEIGVFSNGTEELLHRRTIGGETFNAGDRKTLQGTIQFINS